MSERSYATISLSFIGRIHTPFEDIAKIPIRSADNAVRGTVELFGRYTAGLRDLAGFDRIWLIYHGVVCQPPSLAVLPPMSECLRGVFATKSLRRPNPIGLSCVRLLRVEGSFLHVEDLDMLDGSELLDVKPYVPESDAFAGAWAGWLENAASGEELWPVRQLARF